MKKVVVAMVLFSSACGTESAQERICGAADGCGALAAADVDACVDSLAGVEAERALEECATCLETNTCAQIADGACASTCSAIGAVSSGSGSGSGGVGIPNSTKLRDLDPDQTTDLCHELADIAPRRSAQCTRPDGGPITVVLGMDRASCAYASESDACNATVGQARACYAAQAAVTDLCNLTALPECAPLADCRF